MKGEVDDLSIFLLFICILWLFKVRLGPNVSLFVAHLQVVYSAMKNTEIIDEEELNQ